MELVLGTLLALAVAGCITLAVLLILEKVRRAKDEVDAETFKGRVAQERSKLLAAYEQSQSEVTRLSKWAVVADADDEAKRILAQAHQLLRQAEEDARILTETAESEHQRLIEAATEEAKAATSEARARAKQLRDDAEATLAAAAEQATQIVARANARAEKIAGKAMDAVRNAELYERTARAMKNTIDGYGDAYLKPAESLLDDLAEEFSHKDAGRNLKTARDHTRLMVKNEQAAACDYVEQSRRKRAEHFVLDAFNGKVDSILTRVKHDNFGTLEQEIRDAFTTVNFGGKPFRNARINHSFLEARLAELNWAVVAQELKRQEKEEQRRIREQIREEQRARREYERAIREAEKEEKLLRKAMAEAQARIAEATAEQREQYESQLAELNARLQDAEERNQRAISMAQQTRRGHVYIISNIGSFGENVYKIGLTRRLEPLDRVRELGDASVPFEFDVHAVILSDDAPALETRLHKHFLLNQLNKVNHRKEFFRANLAEIRAEIESMGIEAKWTMVSEAREYRESIAIERAIETDPEAREQWINRQLTLDPVDHAELADLLSE